MPCEVTANLREVLGDGSVRVAGVFDGIWSATSNSSSGAYMVSVVMKRNADKIEHVQASSKIHP